MACVKLIEFNDDEIKYIRDQLNTFNKSDDRTTLIIILTILITTLLIKYDLDMSKSVLIKIFPEISDTITELFEKNKIGAITE